MAKKVDEVKKQREARARKAAYVHRKEQVMEREKENDRLLILFKSNDNWWKMAGNSVLYYTKLVAPRLKKSVKVWPDRDYAFPSKEGIVQVRDLKTFLDEIETLGMRVKPGGGEDYMAVELGYKVTEEELNTMVKEEARRWEMAERMLMPAVIWPGIKAELSGLLTLTWELARKMDTPGRVSFGTPLVEKVVDMIKMLNLAAHDRTPATEALVQITSDIDDIEGLMLAATTLRLFRAQKNYDLATRLMKLKKLIGIEVDRIEKKLKKSK